MAGDWVKLAPKLDSRSQFIKLRISLGLSEEFTLFNLYRLAAWFHEHGDYGQIRFTNPSMVDNFLKVNGFADALISVGWLRIHASSMTLFGFSEASTVRKSLGAKIRAQVLSAGCCAACGASGDLVVDHIVPIVRGGSSKIENLQALCPPCNRSKGRKLPGEWSNKNG